MQASRYSGSICRYWAFGGALRDHRAGPDRPDPFFKTIKPSEPDRGSRRHIEVPHAPKGGRIPARVGESESGQDLRYVSEIEKRTRSLQRQANKTRRFKILKEELRDLQKKTYAIESTRLVEGIDSLREGLKGIRTRESEIRELADEKESGLRQATSTSRVSEEALTELRSKHSENALERDRADREKRYQEEQRTELSKRAEDLKMEVKSTISRIEDLNSEITATKTAAAAETDAAGREREKLSAAEAAYRGVLERVNDIDSRLDVERAEHLQHTAAVERLSEIGNQFRSDLQRSEERIAGLEKEMARASETLETRKTESTELTEILVLEREKLAKSLDEKQESVDACGRARDGLSKTEESLSTIQQEYSRKRHRLDTLKELEETGAIYEPNVQKLISAGKDLGVEILGTLADRFNSDKDSDKAIESLFGAFLQSVLVKTQKDAVAVVKYLHKHGLGRIPVLVSGEDIARSKQKANPEIVRLLGIDDKFAGLLTGVFPSEMTARVVDDLAQVGNSDHLAVTLAGDLVYSGKLFVSGAKDSGGQNTSLLAFKREMRELAKAVTVSEKEVGAATKTVAAARENLKKHEENLVDLQSYIVQLERDMLSREIQSTSVIQEIDRAERHRRVVEDEIAQIRKEIESLETRSKEALESAASAEAARVDSGKKIDQTSLDLVEARKVLEAENIAYNEKRTFAEVAAERMRAAVNALERVNAERVELESRVERQKEEIETTLARIAEIDNKHAELSGRLNRAKDEIEEESVELSKAIEHLKAAREDSDTLSAELAELNTKAAEIRDERANVEIKTAELNTRLQNVEANCSQDLGVELAELLVVVEVDEDFDFDESKERLEVLRNRIENFGAINMLAVEELTETEERLEFLTSQMQDIVDSIGSAEEALREIKRRSRERFKNAFVAINENFTKFFSELFGGGRGEMTLLESEDILEAGIEIIAQPPGKRLQNMLLLSGGEKAMTAIALVLAIFKYRPSPFCLLDEVDAPLDDANVGRFVERIDTMSENTQFIVITHNKRTMEAAKALYGVTMQEAGVSRVVSVRFD